jgi:hypothetical protein
MNFFHETYKIMVPKSDLILNAISANLYNVFLIDISNVDGILIKIIEKDDFANTLKECKNLAN